MKTITVLGNFSGRNAGDAAILGTLLEDISAQNTEVLFKIPTINTNFVEKAYADFNLKPIGLMPWNLSLKIYGRPTFQSVLKSDLVLVTDAILFDRKLYNPLYNYLWTLSRVLPKARKKGIPVVLYNCSLGPARTPAGQECLKRVIDSANIVIVRDQQSIELMQKLGIKHPDVRVGADCALNVTPASEQRFEAIKKAKNIFRSGRPVIGFNINSYVDAYVRQKGQGIARKDFLHTFASVIDKVMFELSAEIVLIETQHMDLGIAHELMDKIENAEAVKIVTNKEFSYQDIAAVLKHMDLFIGMRTHSLIFSSAMEIPVAGIVTYPKNRGFMRSVGLGDYLLDFPDFNKKFYHFVLNAWKNRQDIRAKLKQQVPVEKQKARASAAIVSELLNKH